MRFGDRYWDRRVQRSEPAIFQGYIYDDRELQKKLITLGTDDTVMEFENNKLVLMKMGKEKLDNSKLGKLLQLLAQMEEYTKMLRKKGISLDKFIGLRDKKSWNLP